MKEMSLDFLAFMQLCQKANTIVLTAPAGADGDSVGTQCALMEILQVTYPEKKIRIINEDACPQRYRFLKLASQFEVSREIKITEEEFKSSLWICVDGGPNRLGEKTTPFWKASQYRAQVDHHRVTQKDNFDATLNDVDAASTTQIIYELCQNLRFNLTKDIAQSLYVGLVFDTGLFKHSNTTPKVMRIGAHLLEFGFNHTETAEKTLLVRTEANLKLLQKVLSSMHHEANGLYVWASLNLNDFKEANATLEDREGLIEMLFLTDKCQVASLYVQVEEKKWKASFRSRGHDVATLAKSIDINGGGHKLASGCTLEGDEKTLQKSHDAIKKLFNSST